MMIEGKFSTVEDKSAIIRVAEWSVASAAVPLSALVVVSTFGLLWAIAALQTPTSMRHAPQSVSER